MSSFQQYSISQNDIKKERKPARKIPERKVLAPILTRFDIARFIKKITLRRRSRRRRKKSSRVSYQFICRAYRELFCFPIRADGVLRAAGIAFSSSNTGCIK